MPQQFIREHSGVIAVILGVLFSTIAAFAAWLVKHIRYKVVKHIEKSENELVPHFNRRIDNLEGRMTRLHIENIERFSNLDKRLSIMEAKSRSNMRDVLGVLDKLAVKMDRENKGK